MYLVVWVAKKIKNAGRNAKNNNSSKRLLCNENNKSKKLGIMLFASNGNRDTCLENIFTYTECPIVFFLSIAHF